MSSFPQRRHGVSSPFVSAPTVAFAVIVGSVVVLGLLWGFGVVDLTGSRSADTSTAGMVAVPTVARRTAPYTMLTRDHFWDPKNGRLTVVYLPPRAVTPEMLVKLSDVIGRVLAHEKTPGYVFTASDFLPKGTRDGIVGGIPPGKRAMRIS